MSCDDVEVLVTSVDQPEVISANSDNREVTSTSLDSPQVFSTFEDCCELVVSEDIFSEVVITLEEPLQLVTPENQDNVQIVVTCGGASGLPSGGNIGDIIVNTGPGAGGWEELIVGKPTDLYGFQAKSEDATYKYYFFEDKSLNWYVARKELATDVFDYTQGAGGYLSVYVDDSSGPSGSPTFDTYGDTF